MAKNKCHCESPKLYNHKHDSYWCPKCNIWLDGGGCCKGCEFCDGRPDKPFHNCQYMPSENINVDITHDMMSIKDYKCDTNIQISVNFCPECGHKLKDE